VSLETGASYEEEEVPRHKELFLRKLGRIYNPRRLKEGGKGKFKLWGNQIFEKRRDLFTPGELSHQPQRGDYFLKRNKKKQYFGGTPFEGIPCFLIQTLASMDPTVQAERENAFCRPGREA